MARVAIPARPIAQPESGAPKESRLGVLIPAAVTVVVAALWLAASRSSLTIDEAGTFWVIKDGLAKTFSRALDFQGQSPVFYLVDWLALKIGGHNELALRAPSILAMLATLLPLYKLGETLFDKEAATYATAAFAGTSVVAFAAIDARPYAIALLLTVSATLMLVRWLDSSSRSHHIAYVALAALTIYVHYLYALAFVAHLVYALVRKEQRKALTAFSLVAIACLPLAPQFLALWRRSSSLVWIGAPDALHLALAVRVSLLLLAGGVAFAIARRLRSRIVDWTLGAAFAVVLVTTLTDERILRVTPLLRGAKSHPLALVLLVLLAGASLVSLRSAIRKRDGLNVESDLREHRDALTLLLAWGLAAPVLTFVVSTLTPVKIFAPRYFLSAAPAAALLAGWAMRTAGPKLLRAALVLSLLGAALAGTSRHHSPDDWRSAQRIVNEAVASSSEPVLVSTGFVESNDPAWLTDETKASFLLSPVAFYPMRGRVIALPFDPTHSAAGYVTNLVKELRVEDAFIVVTNKLHLVHGIFERELAPDGFHMETIGRLGWIRVTRFTRTTAG